VISREVERNGGRSAYRVIPAQRRADEYRARPKPRLLEENTALHDAVNSGLKQKWSPKQISKRLREDYPGDDTMRVSHETIVRHEAPGNRVEVGDLRRRSVAAVR
jgi:transposase, IS30 family